MPIMCPECHGRVDVVARNMECGNPFECHPTDVTRIPVCPPSPQPSSIKNPFCGCYKKIEDCWDYYMPGALETRILRLPHVCLRPPCNFIIPPIRCNEPPNPPPEPLCNPLCIDWTMDEPGPNDSYGKNGLNWHDWKMEGITKNSFEPGVTGFTPAHPAFAKAPVPPSTKVYVARQPLECYGTQSPCKREPFVMDVNYFRDWRCPNGKIQPWKPPYAGWATNQHR